MTTNPALPLNLDYDKVGNPAAKIQTCRIGTQLLTVPSLSQLLLGPKQLETQRKAICLFTEAVRKLHVIMATAFFLLQIRSLGQSRIEHQSIPEHEARHSPLQAHCTSSGRPYLS